MPEELRIIVGRHTKGITDIKGGTCLYQQRGDFQIPLPHGKNQGCLPVTARNIQTGAGTNQDLGDFQFSLSSGIH